MNKHYIRYNADDEEPKCENCDHICDNFNCCELCGSENYWGGYIRTESVEEMEENKNAERNS